MTTFPEDLPGSDFDLATAVRPEAAGRFAADVHPQWSIAGRTNGGYLLALAARAALEHLGGATCPTPHPVAATATYLSPVPAGPVHLSALTLRTGRTTSVVRVGLADEAGEPRLEALVTFGRLAVGAQIRHDGVPPVDLPPREDCVRLTVDGPGFRVPIMAVVAEHLDPTCLGWASGDPSGAGELRGYLELADGTAPDPFSLLLAVDALPPASFDLGLGGWVPTLQLTAFVRGLPAPGPLSVRQRARLVEDGRMDETCDVWDSRGRLVATGHQLAAVRMPGRSGTPAAG
jgi:acyl-coenzyme A thioesterase PaaI-like protein